MPDIKENLNEVIASLFRNRLGATQQLETLKKQQIEVPKQIAEQIRQVEEGIIKIDTTAAGLQVLLTESELLEQVADQVAVNSGPLSPASSGGAEAGETGAPGNGSFGDDGSAGLSDRKEAAAGA